MQYTTLADVQPADKGGAVVVWRTDLYIAEAECQLSDTSSYLPLDHGCTMAHQDIVSSMVRGLAMGTYMGPSYACLFIEYVEHS
eukprot:g27257.t1